MKMKLGAKRDRFDLVGLFASNAALDSQKLCFLNPFMNPRKTFKFTTCSVLNSVFEGA